jgi:hypothetical protein
MSNFNNDDVPSGNPSAKTVLIALFCIGVVGLILGFHNALGF